MSILAALVSALLLHTHQTDSALIIWDAKIVYRIGTVVLSDREKPKDIAAAYRKVGGWDFPFPLASPYSKYRLLVKNVARVEERVDSVGNRWCRLFPKDMESPVQVTVLEANRTGLVNLEATDLLPYDLPKEYAGYMRKTGTTDPGAPGAVRLAEDLKGRTRSESIANVWRWTCSVKYGETGIKRDGKRVSSEDSITTRKGVCLDQTESAVAIFRAMGFASRAVRGIGHSWCEVWVPGLGWHIIQQHIDPRRAGWLTGFLAEPLDGSTHSPLLPWDFCNGFYTWQFQEFFIRYRGAKPPSEEYSAAQQIVLQTDRYQPIEQVAKSLEAQFGKALETKLWKD